jgi:predicted Zn-dependent protease
MHRSAKHRLLHGIGLVLLAVACASVPVTGRRQLHLIPESQVRAMSFQSYDQFLSAHTVIRETEEARMVERVGSRIRGSVEAYFAREGISDDLEGYDWEFNLVEDAQVNAWAMPGGKVVVYSGILPVTRDEEGLAVVLGHEIAHAVARHGNERMSQALLVDFGGAALSQLLSSRPAAAQNLFMTAYGIGTGVGVMLPFSRKQESEADHLGLIFMAMAGYDPHGAVDFWRRMAGEKEGPSPPELLSTHPSDETRIRRIEELLPEVMPYYRP